eukprot:2954765-Rhodomonas_salina.6
MSGTGLAALLLLCYVMSGTDQPYGRTYLPTQCPGARRSRQVLAYGPTHALCDALYWHKAGLREVRTSTKTYMYNVQYQYKDIQVGHRLCYAKSGNDVAYQVRDPHIIALGNSQDFAAA